MDDYVLERKTSMPLAATIFLWPSIHGYQTLGIINFRISFTQSLPENIRRFRRIAQQLHCSASYKAENLAEKNVVFKKSKHRSIPRQFPRPHSQLLHHRLAQCNWKQSITTHPLAIQYAGPNCHDDQNVSLPLQ